MVESSEKQLPYPSAAHVETFEATKVLYRVGEEVVLRCRLRFSHAPKPDDDAKAPAPFRIEIWDVFGMGKKRKVAELDLNPKEPTKPQDCVLRFTPAKNELFGHMVTLRVLDRWGRVLSERRALFEVAEDWIHHLRFAATVAYMLVGEHVTEEDMQRHIQHFRRAGINGVELYAWIPESFDLTPESPTWKSIYYRDQHRPNISAEKTIRFRQLLHENGIKLIVYNETSVIDPKIMLQGEDAEPYRVYWPLGNGKFQLMEPYEKDRGCFQPNILKVNELFANELGESVKRFGWDGILMDSATQAFFQTAEGTDKAGNDLTDLTAGQIGRRHIETARKAVKPHNPDFRFLVQNIASSAMLLHHHWKQPDEKLEGVIGDYMRKHYADLFDSADLWSAEMDTHYSGQKNYPQTYDKYAHTINIARAVSGKRLLMWSQLTPPWKGEYTPAFAKPLMSVLSACGVTWHDHFGNYGGWWGGWKDAPVSKAEALHLRFVWRFGEYMRSPDLKWMASPEKQFEVDSSRELFWKRTVYERRLAGGARQVILHLINLDSPNIRPTNHNEPPHKSPPPAFPVSVRLKSDRDTGVTRPHPVPTNARDVRAFAIDSDDEELSPMKLSPQTSDAGIEISIPPVRNWVILVIELK